MRAVKPDFTTPSSSVFETEQKLTPKYLNLSAQFPKIQNMDIGMALPSEKVREQYQKVKQGIQLPNIPELLSDFKNAATNAIRTRYNKLLKSYANYVYSPPEIKKNSSFINDTNALPHHIYIGNRSFQALHTPAENPTELVVFFTGCKSKTVHWQKQIQQLVDEGKSVLTINPRIPGRTTGFYQDNYEMLKYVLFDEESPAHQIAQQDGLKIKIMGHSFGGHLIWRAYKDKTNESNWQKLGNKIETIILMNPFSGSKELNPNTMRGKIGRFFYFGIKGKFNGHAVKHANEYNSENLGDILHAHIHTLTGEPKVWGSNGPPTHGQITEMELNANQLNKEIKEEGFSKTVKDLPIHLHLLLGGKDFMSDPRPNIAIAKELGIKPVIIQDAWHNPWHEKPVEAWNHINRMLNTSAPIPLNKQIALYKKPVEPIAAAKESNVIHLPQARPLPQAATSAPVATFRA